MFAQNVEILLKLFSINRDRHHPFDARRHYRDGPPDFRAGWSREMRGRDGYDAFDGREYDERREYERHFERDRPHPERGKMTANLVKC
jgi:hypothetical protein